MMIQIVLYFYLVYINYLVAAYFNLVCLLISKRFKTILDSIYSLPAVRLEKRDVELRPISLLYDDHHEASDLVDESNKFWQYYIGITFMWVIHFGSLLNQKF